MSLFQNRRVGVITGLCVVLSGGCTPASGESPDAAASAQKAAGLDESGKIRVETATVRKSAMRMNLVRPGEAEASR